MYTTGIQKIWKEDGAFQMAALTGILSEIRSVPLEIVDTIADYLREEGLFYVPDDEYMITYFGESITEYSLGVYRDNTYCKYAYRLVLPVRLLDDSVIGFIGYNNKDDDDPNNPNFVKYLYPNKYTLEKGRYIYCSRKEFELALKEDYVCIVDGLFDQKLLALLGIPAVSLCGSSLTYYHKLYLKNIKHKVIVADNDEAGRRLAYDIKQVWPRAVELKQGDKKDIDSFLRSKDSFHRVKEAIEVMKSQSFVLDYTFTSKLQKFTPSQIENLLPNLES